MAIGQQRCHRRIRLARAARECFAGHPLDNIERP